MLSASSPILSSEESQCQIPPPTISTLDEFLYDVCLCVTTLVDSIFQLLVVYYMAFHSTWRCFPIAVVCVLATHYWYVSTLVSDYALQHWRRPPSSGCLPRASTWLSKTLSDSFPLRLILCIGTVALFPVLPIWIWHRRVTAYLHSNRISVSKSFHPSFCRCLCLRRKTQQKTKTDSSAISRCVSCFFDAIFCGCLLKNSAENRNRRLSRSRSSSKVRFSHLTALNQGLTDGNTDIGTDLVVTVESSDSENVAANGIGAIELDVAVTSHSLTDVINDCAHIRSCDCDRIEVKKSEDAMQHFTEEKKEEEEISELQQAEVGIGDDHSHFGRHTTAESEDEKVVEAVDSGGAEIGRNESDTTVTSTSLTELSHVSVVSAKRRRRSSLILAKSDSTVIGDNESWNMFESMASTGGDDVLYNHKEETRNDNKKKWTYVSYQRWSQLTSSFASMNEGFLVHALVCGMPFAMMYCSLLTGAAVTHVGGGHRDNIDSTDTNRFAWLCLPILVSVLTLALLTLHLSYGMSAQQRAVTGLCHVCDAVLLVPTSITLFHWKHGSGASERGHDSESIVSLTDSSRPLYTQLWFDCMLLSALLLAAVLFVALLGLYVYKQYANSKYGIRGGWFKLNKRQQLKRVLWRVIPSVVFGVLMGAIFCALFVFFFGVVCSALSLLCIGYGLFMERTAHSPWQSLLAVDYVSLLNRSAVTLCGVCCKNENDTHQLLEEDSHLSGKSQKEEKEVCCKNNAVGVCYEWYLWCFGSCGVVAGKRRRTATGSRNQRKTLIGHMSEESPQFKAAAIGSKDVTSGGTMLVASKKEATDEFESDERAEAIHYRVPRVFKRRNSLSALSWLGFGPNIHSDYYRGPETGSPSYLAHAKGMGPIYVQKVVENEENWLKLRRFIFYGAKENENENESKNESGGGGEEQLCRWLWGGCCQARLGFGSEEAPSGEWQQSHSLTAYRLLLCNYHFAAGNDAHFRQALSRVRQCAIMDRSLQLSPASLETLALFNADLNMESIYKIDEIREQCEGGQLSMRQLMDSIGGMLKGQSRVYAHSVVLDRVSKPYWYRHPWISKLRRIRYNMHCLCVSPYVIGAYLLFPLFVVGRVLVLLFPVLVNVWIVDSHVFAKGSRSKVTAADLLSVGCTLLYLLLLALISRLACGGRNGAVLRDIQMMNRLLPATLHPKFPKRVFARVHWEYRHFVWTPLWRKALANHLNDKVLADEILSFLPVNYYQHLSCHKRD